MAALRWMIGGLAGGAVGGLIWVLIGYYANYEVGWIAWGIGFLVGFGARYAAFLGDIDESPVEGFVSAGLAIGSILTAKYIVFVLIFGGINSIEVGEIFDGSEITDESIISGFADEIVEEKLDKGETVNWPDGMTYEEASVKEDYPPQIWKTAETKWNNLGPTGQQERRKEILEFQSAISDIFAQATFQSQFTPWDLLWFGLAAFTAFQIGSGGYGGDD